MREILLLVLLFAFAFASCDKNKLNSELFEKHVLINQCGFRDYELLYTQSVRDTMISLAINGSSSTSKDVIVDLKVNPDTLSGYNWERFRSDESQYYQLLPPDCYEFVADNILMKGHSEYTSVPIRFLLDDIDKDKDYVLPISIEKVSEYSIGPPKYSTVLMHIVLTNEFAGNYAISSKVQEAGSTDWLEVRMNRKLRVVDNNEISLYAGNTSEKAMDREDFRMSIEVNLTDSSLRYIPKYPAKMEIISDTPILTGDHPRNRISVVKTVDVQNNHKIYVATTFYTYYNYKDIKDPLDIREVRVEGSMTRTKIVYLK